MVKEPNLPDYLVEGGPKAPLSIPTTLRCKIVGEGATPFHGLLHFTLDPYLIMLSAMQGEFKYPFLSLWYDSTLVNGPVQTAIHNTNNFDT